MPQVARRRRIRVRRAEWGGGSPAGVVDRVEGAVYLNGSFDARSTT